MALSSIKNTWGSLGFTPIGREPLNQNFMLNIHDLISGGLVGVPLMVIAFVLLYLVFWRDSGRSHDRHK